jgi:hypothetical protein
MSGNTKADVQKRVHKRLKEFFHMLEDESYSDATLVPFQTWYAAQGWSAPTAHRMAKSGNIPPLIQTSPRHRLLKLGDARRFQKDPTQFFNSSSVNGALSGASSDENREDELRRV